MTTTEITETGIDDTPAWRKVAWPSGYDRLGTPSIGNLIDVRFAKRESLQEAIEAVVGTGFWVSPEQFDEIQRRLFDVPAAAEPKRISFPVEREEITRDFAFSLLFEGTGLAEDDINDALAEVLDGRMWLTPEKFGEVQDRLLAENEAPKRVGVGASVVRGQLLTEGFTADEVATAIGRAMEVTGQSGITDPVFTADEEAQIRANLCEAAGIPTDPRLMTIRLLAARNDLAEAYNARNYAERALASFRALVREVAVREADRRGWCEEFDEILEEIGLEPRRNPRYEATLVIRVRFTAEASDRDRQVYDGWVESCIQGDDEIKDAIREYFSLDSDNMEDSLDIDSISFDVEDSEVIESAE